MSETLDIGSALSSSDQPFDPRGGMTNADPPESKPAPPRPSPIQPHPKEAFSRSETEGKGTRSKSAPRRRSVSAQIILDAIADQDKKNDKSIPVTGSVPPLVRPKKTAEGPSERPSEELSERQSESKRKEQSEDDEPLPTDGVGGTVHNKLMAIYEDDVVFVAQSKTNQRSVHYTTVLPQSQSARHYFELVILETTRYIRWIVSTWANFFLNSAVGGLGLFDIFTTFTFAAGGTVLLGVALLFSLIVRLPGLVTFYYATSDWLERRLGLFLVANPKLFKSMTSDQSEAAKRALSRAVSKNLEMDPEHERRFNYDISKMLLQIAAIVYEHENDAVREAVELAGPTPRFFHITSPPIAQKRALPKDLRAGALLSSLLRPQMAAAVQKILRHKDSDAKIHEFCDRYGLEFRPISQLGDTSSAFAGLFWDPASNWIVVSFKGTGPLEFGDWLSDFDAKLYHIGSFIDGFSKAHKGFKDRLFPRDVSPAGSRRAYDNIALGIKTLAKSLREQQPEGTQINIWVTGHSLGCATASLAYSRFLVRPRDIGKNSVLRDAYLFAAPIVADRRSVDVFNAKMSENPEQPKTMWRVTSNRDIVATGIPEIGDWTSINASPNNNFAYAHLGTEVELLDAPISPRLAGNHILRGALVNIESEFTPDQIEKQRQIKYERHPKEQKREAVGKALQRIPLIGRIFAHFTVNYWDQLDRISTRNPCSWAPLD